MRGSSRWISPLSLADRIRRDDPPSAVDGRGDWSDAVEAHCMELTLHVCLGTMADRWPDATDGYSFRFFSSEQVDQILRDGLRRGREGSHAAIERILKHEPGLQRAELWQRNGWRGKREAVRELLRRHPDWRPHLIWRRAAKLGLVRPRTKRCPERYRRRWSEDEDRVLLNLAGYRKLRMIAKLLHRSERGVRYRLAVLGKSGRVHFDGYARRALAEQLHFGRRTIQRLIVEGLLEVRDPRITPESLRALRRSGRLTSLQLHHESEKRTSHAVMEQKAGATGDVENRSSDVNDTSIYSRKASRARRVWTEVSRALNVTLEAVESLIVARSLKVYDPRITERSLINFCRRNGSLINWELLDGETQDWLQSSMDLDRSAGQNAAARLNAFRKHALVVRRCTECGRSIRGNAFFRHIKRCGSPKSQGIKTPSPVDVRQRP